MLCTSRTGSRLSMNILTEEVGLNEEERHAIT
jgi:hypothetical protein